MTHSLELNILQDATHLKSSLHTLGSSPRPSAEHRLCTVNTLSHGMQRTVTGGRYYMLHVIVREAEQHEQSQVVYTNPQP